MFIQFILFRISNKVGYLTVFQTDPGLETAVVEAESCGRWSRIVRSIGLNRAVVVRKADEETCQTVRPCTQRESTSVFDQYVTDKDEADPLSVGLGGEERAE